MPSRIGSNLYFFARKILNCLTPMSYIGSNLVPLDNKKNTRLAPVSFRIGSNH